MPAQPTPDAAEFAFDLLADSMNDFRRGYLDDEPPCRCATDRFGNIEPCPACEGAAEAAA